MIEALLAISVATGLFSMSAPSAGTFTAVSDGSSIIRMDTRTGTMERCSVVGNAVNCTAITAEK